jgi:hypothetical protein
MIIVRELEPLPLTPFASLPTVSMGPRFREDDGGVFVGVLRKFPNSNFKQPSALVLTPPRELVC